MDVKPYIFITDFPEKGGRRFAIPDIHGCFYSFQALIKKLALTADDHVYILGDMINRGKRSSFVIDFILHLYSSGYKIFPLQGNHENNVIQRLITSPVPAQEALHSKSLKVFTENGIITPAYDVFYRTLPHCIISGDDYILTHAGMNFEADPFKDFESMLYLRDFKYDGNKVKRRKLIHGHTPKDLIDIRYSIDTHSSVICLDNGCVMKGKNRGNLLCLDLDTLDLIIQKNID